MTSRSTLATLLTLLLGLGLAACESSTGVDAGAEGTATVAFRTPTTTGSGAATTAGAALSHTENPDAATFTVDGTNGQLTLADVHFTLAEFELERAEGARDCEDDEGDGEDDEDEAEDDCEEFEAPPRFLELPLDGEAAVAVRQTVPTGLYDELEFEIENLDLDEEEDEAAQTEALAAEIRTTFPEWPDEASLRVHGTFTPKDDQGDLLTDEARTFTAYFDAEVEIEREFASTVEITEGDQSFTVTVDPRLWFERVGVVPDLSRFDFDPTTGEPVPEFELEMETKVGEGFSEVEFEG